MAAPARPQASLKDLTVVAAPVGSAAAGVTAGVTAAAGAAAAMAGPAAGAEAGTAVSAQARYMHGLSSKLIIIVAGKTLLWPTTLR